MKFRTAIVFASIFIMAFTGRAMAGQSAELVCINNPCDRYELHVSITADGDAGMQGAYGVIAIPETTITPMSKASEFGHWSLKDGWSPYKDGEVVRTADEFQQTLVARRDFVVLRGTKDHMCQVSLGRGFHIYAWHAALRPDQLKKMETFLDRFQISGWQAENFRRSVFFYEAHVQKKVGLVYTLICPAK